VTANIKVKDRDTLLEISYEDMIKYAGRFHIGGVAIAFKVLELGFSKLLPGGEIPSRKKIGFASGLGESAMGVLDAVEMATRARTRGNMNADIALGRDIEAPQNPDGGKFYFELSYGDVKLGLALKMGLIPEEFTYLLRIAMDRPLSKEEAKRLQEVKEEIAASVISMEAEDLFNCIYY